MPGPHSLKRNKNSIFCSSEKNKTTTKLVQTEIRKTSLKKKKLNLNIL